MSVVSMISSGESVAKEYIHSRATLMAALGRHHARDRRSLHRAGSVLRPQRTLPRRQVEPCV